MGHLSLVETVQAWFLKYEVPATAVWGQRARPAQGNAKPGSLGGRVSFLWPGKATGQGPTWLGSRPAVDTISDPALVELAARVRAARLGHWATGAPVHLAASSPSVPAEPTSLIEAFDVANAVRLAELEHDASPAAHLEADTVNALTAPAASTRATLRTLLLQLQERGNAHDRSLTAHGEADEDHDADGEDPLSTSATSRAINQLVIELEAEVWAWDDSGSTDDVKQEEAWWNLAQATINAVRFYAQGTFKLDRTEPASQVVHVVRGVARLMYFKLPVPIDQLPNMTPRAIGFEATAKHEQPQGQEPDGTPNAPVVETVGTVDIPPV